MRFYHDYSDRLHFAVSSYISAADKNYMHRYFGVSEQEAIESPYIDQAYNADGGLKSIGIGLDSTYDFTDKVRGHLRFDLENFIGSAGESPIIEDGSSLQFTGRIGLSYLISIELYDHLFQ